MNKVRYPDKTFTKEEIESIGNNVKDLYELKSVKASQIKPAQQPWLWKNYIPLEGCTLIAGKGGIGKSQFLMWLTSIVSNGKTFSINSITHEIKKGSVIILSAEDHERYTIIPRLISLNADLDNVEIVESAVDIQSKLKERFVTLDKDIQLLEKKITEIKNVKLIIIDPITAYLGNIKENKSTDVRSFILRLNKLAEKYNLSIILNTHTRKQSSGENPSSASDEIMGSSAWANTVRMAFSITRDHHDEDLYLCTCSKTNYKKPESLAYRINHYEFKYDDLLIETSFIEWHNGKINMTADEAVNKKAYEERLDVDIAKEFILKTLKLGRKEAQAINKLAEDQGINLNTLKSARQKLKKEGTNIVLEPSPTDGRKMIWYLGN